MKKKIMVALACLSLFACNELSGDRGTDGYRFGDPQLLEQTSQINIVLYDSYTDLVAEGAERGLVDDNSTLEAFSEVGDGFCTIHMIDPKVTYTPEFVGHEALHCFYGQWHTSNNQRG